MRRIYLDHAATTPVHPRVAAAMRPWIESDFGNPSSLHEEGRRAKEALDQAREVVSETIGCSFGEVTFTSSGSEAANHALIGVALAFREGRRKRVIIGAAEHHCVLETEDVLRALGMEVLLVPVDREARIDLDALQEMTDDETLLIAVMSANNEFGTIQPVQNVARIARSSGALFMCDAVQSFGTQTVSVGDWDVDLLTLSAHKLNGPKGVGALYTRAGIKIKPLIVGGGQEREQRAGTENVAGIVGFGEAIRVALADEDRVQRKQGARDAFWETITAAVPDGSTWTVSDRSRLLPGHAHLRIEGVSAESMLVRLDRMGVSASSGAACSSGSVMPSHVMMASGYSEAESKEGLRFTFGFASTEADGREGAERVLEALDAIRLTQKAR